MSYIDWKKLKERVSLRDILDHYGLLGDLTEAAHGFEGVCPFCESRSFKANTEKNAWFCFGACKTKAEANGGQIGGNILDLVARMEEVSVKKAAELIAEWFLEYPAPSATGTKRSVPPAQRKNAPTPDAKKHLKKEGETDVSRHRAPKEPAPKSKEIQDVPEAGAVRGTKAEGDSKPLPTPQEAPTVAPSVPFSFDFENKPLPFVLKGIVTGHQEVIALGVTTAIAERYGAGYFTGKGSMAGRVVFPFHDGEGQIIGYAGYESRDRSWKYPPADKFNPTREVFGIYQAKNDDTQHDTIAVCRTPLAALQYRSAQQGVLPIAITTDTLSRYQEDVIADLMTDREQLLFVAARDDLYAIDVLGRLLERYFVKYVRT